ncbi:MAG: type III pantothenate kinase, partial [Desulfovibrionaceae bacterium]|nr:type III pantothenate kinase [Desulfovibrionaceae bacterium]
TPDAWGLLLRGALGHAGCDVSRLAGAVICGVVPPVHPLISKALMRFFGIKPLFVPDDLPIPMANKYQRPAEVGADRLVTAFAARRLFSEPSLIAVDFGTATTFDCVTGDDYLGGLICPGVLSSAQALASNTAKLPHISLELDSKELHIGRGTAESLSQGLIFGFAALAEGLIARLAAQLPGPVAVVATGGFAEVLGPVCPALGAVRPDLLLEGLGLLCEESGIFR